MQIAIGVFDGMTILDVIGPYQVLALLPAAEIILCAEQPGQIVDDNGLIRLQVDHSFSDVPRPDVLVVGGGYATRRIARDGAAIIDWIHDAHPHTRFTTSVCTGALLLAAAGILEGCCATTHWRAHDTLREMGAIVVDERVCIEGKTITAAGVSAGIDMALTLASKLVGEDTARAIQLAIEYDPQPPFDEGAVWKASSHTLALTTSMYAARDARRNKSGT